MTRLYWSNLGIYLLRAFYNLEIMSMTNNYVKGTSINNSRIRPYSSESPLLYPSLKVKGSHEALL